MVDGVIPPRAPGIMLCSWFAAMLALPVLVLGLAQGIDRLAAKRNHSPATP